MTNWMNRKIMQTCLATCKQERLRCDFYLPKSEQNVECIFYSGEYFDKRCDHNPVSYDLIKLQRAHWKKHDDKAQQAEPEQLQEETEINMGF